MKKFFVYLTILISLSACSNSSEKNEGMREQVSKDLSTALEKRWAITSTADNNNIGAEEGIREEFNHLKQYADFTVDDYNDNKLYTRMDSYMRELENGIFIIDTFGIDNAQGSDKWQEHQAKRLLLLAEVNEVAPISVSNDNEQYLDEVLSYGNNLKEANEKEELLKEAFGKNNVQYSKIETEENNIIVTLENVTPLNEQEFLKSFASDTNSIISSVKDMDFSELAIIRKTSSTSEEEFIGALILLEKSTITNVNTNSSVLELFNQADAYRINNNILQGLDSELKNNLDSVKEGSSNYALFNTLSSK